MIDIIICDDMEEHVCLLEHLIIALTSEKKLQTRVVLATTDFNQVSQYAAGHSGSINRVYILDIDLNSDKTGLDLAAQIREKDRRSYIVFLTGHAEFIHKSFKAKPFDFIIKPAQKERISDLLDALIEDIEILKQNQVIPSLKLVVGATTHFIHLPKIIYMEKLGKVLSVYMINEVLQCYYNLKTLEPQLLPHGFYRCHKSYLINIQHVIKYDRSTHVLIMTNDTPIPVSRTYRKAVVNYVKQV